MTAPKRDGRSMLERARELAKLSGYAAHERSSEIADALRAMMLIVDRAVEAVRNPARRAALEDAIEHACEPYETIDGIPTHRRRIRTDLPDSVRRPGTWLRNQFATDTPGPPPDPKEYRREVLGEFVPVPDPPYVDLAPTDFEVREARVYLLPRAGKTVAAALARAFYLARWWGRFRP